LASIFTGSSGAAKLNSMPPAEVDAAVMRVEALAKLMDSAFVIPGTSMRMGLDAFIGLVPVLGDMVTTAISSYIIWEAKNLGVSKFTLWRMIGNTAIDGVVGLIPLAGDAFDVAFRANLKNLALLKRHLEKNKYQTGAAHGRINREMTGRGPVIEGTATRLD
jgi:hypothetical protein